MAKFKTFPTTNIHVIDKSGTNPEIPEELPMHLPCFISFGEKGIGMGYGTYDELSKKFGEGTFDSRSKWFFHPNLFLRTAAQSQPVFFYRLIPNDAVSASMVLEAHVWDDQIEQYQRDHSGRYILDSNNEKIPLLDDGPVITELMWDTDIHADSETHLLTIIASDYQDTQLTYNVTCNDNNVNIVQDSVNPNVFSITYPDYSTTRTDIVFSITVTDSDSNSKTAELVQFVNIPNTDPVYGYYWDNIDQHANSSYKLMLILNPTTDTTDVTATVDGNAIDSSNYSNITDIAEFDITYTEFNSYPKDVIFTITASDSNNPSAEVSFTDTRTVLGPDTSIPNLFLDGVKIEWKTRTLLNSESISGLLPQTQIVGSKTVTIYPILVFTPKDGPGAYGNNIGVKLYWDRESDIDIIRENEALIYTIQIVDQPYGYDLPIIVRDFYNQNFDEFMFYPDGINKVVDMRMDFDSIMKNSFRDDLPFNYHVYTENIKTIGARIKALETNITEITTEWMANVFTAESTDGIPYYRTEIITSNPDSELMDKDIVHYLKGGSDGTINNDNLEALSKLFFSGDLFPEIKDKARWPINHLYDSGYSLEISYSMYDMLDIREDIKILSSTIEVIKGYNTEAEDQSAASALRMRALLHPESVIDGTDTCRVTIFQQACHINFDDTYKDVVPMTMKGLLDRCKFHNASFIKGEWTGLPNASVDFIKDISWAPYDDNIKQLNWDTAANYCQFYDMSRLHYPSIISVYKNLTSLLSSDIFTTYICYLKQIVYRKWAKYVGLDEPISTLKYKIEKDFNTTVYDKFKNYIKVIPNVYQSDLDKQLGYALTVELAIYDSVAKRLWNVPIPCRRIETLNQQ